MGVYPWVCNSVCVPESVSGYVRVTPGHVCTIEGIVIRLSTLLEGHVRHPVAMWVCASGVHLKEADVREGTDLCGG